MKATLALLATRLLACFYLVLFGSGAAFAQDETNDGLLIILDASNSMWGQIEGENKIVIARRVLRDLLQQRDSATTIVLVSDGIETCNADPCAAVRTAKREGAHFLMHVVGFDVGDVDIEQLECAAQAGEGLYLNAGNADELLAALNQAVEITPVTAAATLSVGAIANGELTDAIVSVIDPATGDDVLNGRAYAQPETNPRLFPVATGRYRVVVKAIRFNGIVEQSFEDVVVSEGEIAERTADFSTGEIAIKVMRNGKLADATVNVRDSATQQKVAGSRTYVSESSNPTVIELTAGTYDIRIDPIEIAGQAAVELNAIKLEPGQRFEHEQEFGSGILRVGAINGDQLQDATVKVERRGDRREVVASGRTYAQANSNPKSFELPPGAYEVTVQAVGLKGDIRQVASDIEVLPGETTEHIANFTSGKLRVKITRNGELSDAAVAIISQTTGKNVASGRSYTTSSNNPMSFELTPGIYEIRLDSTELAGRARISIPDVQVGAGAEILKAHEYRSGTLSVNTVHGGQATDAVIQVLDSDRRSVDSGRTYAASEGTVSFILAPGSYIVRGTPTNRELGGRQESGVEVGVGARTSHIVEFGE